MSVGWVVVSLILLANALVCVLAVQSDSFSRGQLAIQFAFVWLVPAVGALVVGMVLWSVLSPGRTRRRLGPGESGNLGEYTVDGNLSHGGDHGHAP